MSSFPPHPLWQTHLDPKSQKPYYHNKQTNVTTYIVPDDLLTPAQVSLLHGSLFVLAKDIRSS